MESSDSLPSDSFKSKKMFHLSSPIKPSMSDQMTNAQSDWSPWCSKTPDKPADPPRRARNQQAVLSVKEVREAAAKLQESVQDLDPCHHPDPVSSDGQQQIGSGPDDSPIGELKQSVDGSIKLSGKFEILGKFFDSLDTSIRLLRLKGSMPTFSKISPKVECLTDRRFSHCHLAQLKFILPEVIEIKKVLILDERTSCMKPDLHVTLNIDAIKDEGKLKSASVNLHMRKVFRDRLLNFLKNHPEGDVPKETLPEPFDQPKQDVNISTTKASSSSLFGETLTVALAEQQPAAASHLSLSFRKHFSLSGRSNEAVDSYQQQSIMSLQPSDLTVSEPHADQSSSEEKISVSTSPPVGNNLLNPVTRQQCLSLGASQASVPSHPPATPVKEIISTKNQAFSSVRTATIQETPAKFDSTPMKLMSATPPLRPPMRCYMSPDNDSACSPRKLVTRPPPIRILKFDTPMKNAEVKDEVNHTELPSVDNDIFEILPEKLLQSNREKGKRALDEQDPAMSQANRRQQMIASLPKLFDTIYLLFQSIKHSVVTKEELLHKIMANDLDIVDRREVEEQLILLQELVPEWIFEKSASSGDHLISINKISSPDFMRARLLEAK